jgi:haloacetate dehalogenase
VAADGIPMENIHAMCQDYRAAASIDLQHDKADLDKDPPPSRRCGGERGPMGRLYDVLAI